MKDNMYQKVDPIKKPDGRPASLSVKRNAYLTCAYTINNSADAYLPKKKITGATPTTNQLVRQSQPNLVAGAGATPFL